MKKVLHLCWLFLCLSQVAQAQVYRYSIAIADSAGIPTFSGGSPGSLSFTAPSLNAIVTGSPVYNFSPAYPGANSPFLRDIYLLETDDSTLPYRLHAQDPTLYYYVRQQEAAQLLATPNDWVTADGCDTPRHLEYIGARRAWDYSKGDTSTIIGIADNGFDTSRPDMRDTFGSKYYKFLGINHTSPGDNTHGNKVAGTAAGGTDNGHYLPSIGWKCRLEVTEGITNMSGIFKLGKDSLPVINASFGWLTYQLEDEAVANEVYEMGTNLVAAAGNGFKQDGAGYFVKYPASFCNVISVSGVGHTINPGSTYPIFSSQYYGRSYSVKDQHIFLRTGNLAVDSAQNTATHNRYVDICAPAYGVPTMTDSVRGGVLFPINCSEYGTSFAAPLVSGTIGLMKARKPNLTPYQMEVILKKTARFLDTIGDNYLFAGQLGAGALRADSALAMADTFNTNNPAMQTMYIAGVGFNHLCLDGNVDPTEFSVNVINGNGHYRYEWIPFPGNQVTLDNRFISTPHTVFAASSGPLFHYMLRVTDSSAIPKVAQRELKIMMRTSDPDLTMRDSEFDMLNEPNDQESLNHPQIWESPDLWNRKANDGVRIPEDAEYFHDTTHNYLYVRIRNVGCQSSGLESVVKLYWTLSATGERWPGAWDTATYCSTGGGRVDAGGQLTASSGIAIPSLAPGDSFVVSQPWKVIKPDTFCNYAHGEVDICVLARIEESGKSLLGMHDSEIANISQNVRRNNNIVTRNLSYVNLGHKAGTTGPPVTTSTHTVIVASHHTGPVTVSLQMLVDRDLFRHFAGDLSPYMYVTVHLGNLYDRWMEGGGLGKYAAIDTTAKTVTYDFSKPLRLDNIVLQEEDEFPVELTFSLRDSITLDWPIANQRMHFRQLLDDAGKQVVDGNVSFAINIDNDGMTSGQRRIPGAASASKSGYYTVFPNPVASRLNIGYDGLNGVHSEITVSDIVGHVVYFERAQPMQAGASFTVAIGGFMPGVYIVKIRDDRGGAAVFKVLKQ